MRNSAKYAVLSAAAVSVVSLSVARWSGAQIAPIPERAAATQPAARQPQGVPVKEVVLFTSGVGYFEHFGTVGGNASTDLSFKTNQINDILKSLLLEDLDGGKVSVVTYGSQEPLARTLRSFQIDLSNDPPLSQILGQLRGSGVTATLADKQITGTILGVEKKQKPAGDNKVVDVWVLDLLLPGGTIRPVEFDQMSEVRLDDPRLQEELTKALIAVAASRDQDKKPVTIHFNGQGERHVRIGYVVEAPVWKASYRIVLDPAGKNEKADEAKPGATDDKKLDDADVDQLQKKRTAGVNPRGNHPADGGRLQGWAIVENQTDNDWEDVQLSLVSGRPISFIEDLYQPLYVPRQVVQPQLYASLQPQTYAEGMQEREDLAAEGKVSQLRAQLARRARGGEAGGMFGGAGGAASPVPGAAPKAALSTAGGEDRPINPLTSVLPAASGAAVGEFFQYTVPNVSLSRQKSAMIPILSDGVKVRRLSIFNASVLATNPLLGARLTNTTGKLLPQGPITVLDGGVYAGDAKIDDLPAGQNRLFSYGIDQNVLVHSNDRTETSTVVTGRIIKGVLEVTTKNVFSQKYVADNRGKTDRPLLIEHPRRSGWTLVQPAKAQETTDALYRFEESLPAGKSKTLAVQEELTSAQGMAILPLDTAAIESYRQTGTIPQKVKDALGKAAQLKYAMVDTQHQIQERQQRLNDFNQEQGRIRENMKAVDRNTDYYKRLLKELDDQETAIQKLQDESKQFQGKLNQQRKDLEDYLANLDVG